MDTHIASDGLPAGTLRRRLLPVFLATSAALHAAVVIVIPPPELAYEPARARVLEVMLVQAEPARQLPVEPEITPLPPPPSRAAIREPARQVAAVEPRRAEVQPMLALPDPVAATEPAAAVPPAAEKRAPPSAPRSDVASVARPRNPELRYPYDARLGAGEQGTVIVRVLVTREGRPARVEIEKSSGSARLDAAAREAVSGWQFEPARQGAEPIDSWNLVPVVFRLKGDS